MPQFTIPYTTSGNYTYDSNKIQVSVGLAALIDLEYFTNLESYWKFDNTLTDSSTNGYDLTGTPSYVTGKLGQARGSGLLENTSVPNFSFGTSDFTIQFWVKFNGFGSNRAYVYLWGGLSNIEIRTNAAGNIIFNTFNSGTGASGISGPVLSIDTWYLITCVRSGTDHYLYVDTNPTSSSLTVRSIDATTIRVGNTSSGTRPANGSVDNLAIWSKPLSSGDVIATYNSGNGLVLTQYAMDSPTIHKTAGESDTGITSWAGFTETLGGGNVGSIAYQLSVDGAIWEYWNGSAWVTAGGSNYNTAATINTNIGSFSVQDSIYVKSFLISNGNQAVELDENQITYITNICPTVSAGSNKGCKDGQTISPFSDCSFSDADGSVIKAEYKIVGEVDTWTEIPQGRYGTLLEAVQAWQYQFNNIDIITASLRVTDDASATSEDSLTVTVTQYTRTVNIRHSVTGEHIIAVEFDPGDGSGFTLRNSPFVYSWDYSTVNTIMQANGFYSKVQSVLIDSEADLDLTMSPVSYVNEGKASIGLITDTDTLVVNAWFQKNGEVFITPTSCSIDFKDKDGVSIYSDTSSLPDAEGIFLFEQTPSGLTDEGVYRLDVSIIVDAITYVSVIPVGKIQRDRFSLDGKVYIDTVNGVIGTIYPKGTFNKPVNNWADAKVIADANFIKRFVLRGSLILLPSEDIGGYEFAGDTSAGVKLTFGGGNTLGGIFNHLTVKGPVNGAINVQGGSKIDRVTNFEGTIRDSGLINADPITCLTLGGSTAVTLVNCWSEVPGAGTPVVDMGGAGRGLNVRALSGGIKLINKTGTESVTLEFIAGQYKLDSTVTNGYITIRGISKKGQDDSGPGCTVNTDAAVMNPWASLIAENAGSGSFGEVVNLLRAEAVGKMVIDPSAKTLTLYDLDEVTILKVFDLTDTIITLPSFIGRTPQ